MKMWEVLCKDPDIDEYIFESPTHEGVVRASLTHRRNCRWSHSAHLVESDGNIEEMRHFEPEAYYLSQHGDPIGLPLPTCFEGCSVCTDLRAEIVTGLEAVWSAIR